ncbi:hypothetical protein [Streptomyces sp. NPDC047000]
MIGSKILSPSLGAEFTGVTDPRCAEEPERPPGRGADVTAEAFA